MRRLAKNLILTTAAVSAIFLVDLSTAEAITQKKICPLTTDIVYQQIDFWGKFRDTVMPKPDEPQNNNPPKEMKRPRPKTPPPQNKPKPAN